MEHLRWTTVTSWIEETLEIFSFITKDFNINDLSKKVENGDIFLDKKESSAKRIFQSIKARYLNIDEDKVYALSIVLNSKLSYQEKCNYLLIYYLEYETLARLFLEGYVYENFNKYGQKVYTQMDLDKFFEMVFDQYNEYLPKNIQENITDSSMIKVRNTLYKNIEYFGWINSSDGKINIKRPKLTPEWFVFTLYLYFKENCIDAKEVYNSPIYKRFLLNEYDIEYLITGAKLKDLIHTERLGHVNTITKHEKGLVEYARNYK